jgi:3-dehydroquinate dehydratase
VCSGFISGFGLDGYDLAVLSFLRKNVQDVKLYRV